MGIRDDYKNEKPAAPTPSSAPVKSLAAPAAAGAAADPSEARRAALEAIKAKMAARLRGPGAVNPPEGSEAMTASKLEPQPDQPVETETEPGEESPAPTPASSAAPAVPKSGKGSRSRASKPSAGTPSAPGDAAQVDLWTHVAAVAALLPYGTSLTIASSEPPF